MDWFFTLFSNGLIAMKLMQIIEKWYNLTLFKKKKKRTMRSMELDSVSTNVKSVWKWRVYISTNCWKISFHSGYFTFVKKIECLRWYFSSLHPALWKNTSTANLQSQMTMWTIRFVLISGVNAPTAGVNILRYHSHWKKRIIANLRITEWVYSLS